LRCIWFAICFNRLDASIAGYHLVSGKQEKFLAESGLSIAEGFEMTSRSVVIRIDVSELVQTESFRLTLAL
jgi:hypothetical protein